MKHGTTDRENAVLFALAAGYLKSWTEAFILSRQEPEESKNNYKKLSSSVSHWKQHPVTVQAYNEILLTVQARDKKIIEDELKKLQTKQGPEDNAGDSDSHSRKAKNAVDYYNPENQRNQINKIIAESGDDPKTQLDAIKAIQQTQRDDKQAAREGKTVKVYLPLTCDTCPVLLKAREKAKNG